MARILGILTVAANDLYNSIQSVDAFAFSVRQALKATHQPKENYEELSIFFSSPTSFDDLTNKLSALRSIYSELCRLLNLSETEYPLEVIKVESGSLWIKLFGESRVIRMMTEFAHSAVTYLYRNFTVEGRVSAVPKNAEVIDSLLDLSKRLKESGIDNSVLNDNIKHSAVLISQQLNRLLEGEPSVEINGKHHSVSEEWEARYLKESRNLFLDTGTGTEPHDHVEPDNG